MNLSDIYREGGFQALKALAATVGADAQYLRQCATGWRGKRPSPELAAKLIASDPRLTWDDMYRRVQAGGRAADLGASAADRAA